MRIRARVAVSDESNVLFYGRIQIFRRKSRWYDAELEKWPTWLIVIHLCVCSFVATVIGGLLKLGVDAIVRSVQPQHPIVFMMRLCWS
jgi:hypothetical protein